MGVKVRGGREVYAARACAGKYTMYMHIEFARK